MVFASPVSVHVETLALGIDQLFVGSFQAYEYLSHNILQDIQGGKDSLISSDFKGRITEENPFLHGLTVEFVSFGVKSIDII